MPHTTNRYSQPLNPHAPVFTPSTSSPNPPTPAFYSPCNRLNVGHINICSLRHQTHVSIAKLIDEHCLDLLAVTETELDSSISDTEVSVPGTILLRRDRPCVDGCTCLSACTPCRKGGGICIFVKEHVKAKHILDHSHSSLELMWLRAGKGKDSTLLGCIYRPPSEPVEFWNRLATSTEQLDGENNVLLGDIHQGRARRGAQGASAPPPKKNISTGVLKSHQCIAESPTLREHIYR